MIKSKVHEIFCGSVDKLNKMISHLDKQLGLNSDISQAQDHLVNVSATSPNLINTEHVHEFNKNEDGKVKDKSDINAAKKEKKENAKKAQPKQQAKEDPAISIFNEVDLRVGRIVELKNKENSEEIYELKVDLGEKNLRNIGTGLRKFVPPEELKDKLVVVFANLKPKKLGNFVSEGMILSSHNEDGTKFEMPRPNENSKPGDSVYIGTSIPKESFLAPLSDNKFKKAVVQLKTDDNYIATYNGITLQTTSGPVSVKSLKNCSIS